MRVLHSAPDRPICTFCKDGLDYDPAYGDADHGYGEYMSRDMIVPLRDARSRPQKIIFNKFSRVLVPNFRVLSRTDVAMQSEGTQCHSDRKYSI